MIVESPEPRQHGAPPGTDLRLLSRGAGAGRPSDGTPPAGRVPAPPFAWKTRVLVPAAILLAAAGLLGYSARDALWPARVVRAVPVVVKIAAEGGAEASGAAPGTVTVQAAGWVEPDPYPIHVSALTDGIVREVLVLEGHRVAAGDVVARLVDEDAGLALAKAEAEVADRAAALTAATLAWENPVEPTRAVETAKATAAGAEAELARLDAEVGAEVAKADELRDQLERAEGAFERSAGTESVVVQTRLRLKAQEATVEAVKLKRPVLEAALAKARHELTASRENLRLRIEERRALASAKAALALAQAARDEAKLRLDRMEVRAPASGVVMARLAEPGSKLVAATDHPQSAHVARLYDPARLQVRVDVPLADAARVSVGQEAQVIVGVLPDRVFKGRVTRAAHEADVQKNTQQFKVRVLDPAPELMPEMLARVKFLAPAATGPAATTAPGTGTRQLVFAPENLVRHRPDGGASVWVVEDREGQTGVARLRPVRPGNARQGGWVSIADGLRPGDTLISDDPAALRDGQKIRLSADSSDPSVTHQSPLVTHP